MEIFKNKFSNRNTKYHSDYFLARAKLINIRGDVMPETYEDYKKHVSSDIESCLEGMGCQPILFIGSGLSQRYIKAPTWEGLLKKMVEICPQLTKNYAYYKQTYTHPIRIASHFINAFKEWAWADQTQFPPNLYSEHFPPDIYLKHKISEYIHSLTPSLETVQEGIYKDEVASLRSINPHSIITTNYDTLIERLFPSYEPIIGQKILKSNLLSVGEIFKVHGCATDPESIVVTQSDYEEFTAKKKYLSAKLLAFFAEHPVLFIGYSTSDPNIQAILSDIDEIISEQNDIIPNVYMLQWNEDATNISYPQREAMIHLNERRSIRVKCIVSSDFTWVFNAFSNHKPIDFIRPNLLRALMARTYDIVRHDIPRKTIEVDYSTLEHALSTDDALGKLLGITAISDPSQVNAQYPFSLTQVGKELGHNSWHKAHQLIEQVQRDKSFDIKSSDNKYHISIKAGDVMKTHKYSHCLVDLLRLIQEGKTYELNL